MIEPKRCPKCKLIIDMDRLDSCICPKCKSITTKNDMLWVESSNDNLNEAYYSRLKVDFDKIEPKKCPKCGSIVDARGITDYWCAECETEMQGSDLIAVEKTDKNKRLAESQRAIHDTMGKLFGDLEDEKKLEDIYKLPAYKKR